MVRSSPLLKSSKKCNGAIVVTLAPTGGGLEIRGDKPTGLAIAGGGSAITAVLARDWPDWVVGLLASVFIIVGFTIVQFVMSRRWVYYESD